jgi:hypothetical protein
MVERLIWPGLTGKKIVFSAIHGRGSFSWKVLADVIEKAGFDIHASIYVESAVMEIPTLLERRNRVVAVVDLFEDWPKRDPIKKPSFYAETILKLRNATKGTADEVVFILYQHPDAFSNASHDLPNDLVKQFQRYFQIQKTFDDSSHNPEITAEGKETLTRNFKDTLYKVERLLLRTEQQPDGASFPMHFSAI